MPLSRIDSSVRNGSKSTSNRNILPRFVRTSDSAMLGKSKRAVKDVIAALRNGGQTSQDTMSAFLKSVLTLVALICAAYFALGLGASYADSVTREHLKSDIARELRQHASFEEETAFMRRHTIDYTLENNPKPEYVGVLGQTRLERILKRKVQIVLKLDKDRTFAGSEIRIFYTTM